MCSTHHSGVAQMVKNLPAMQDTWVQSLGQEDPLEEGMASHSSMPPWRIPQTGEPGLQSMRSQRVRQEWTRMHAMLNLGQVARHPHHPKTEPIKAVNLLSHSTRSPVTRNLLSLWFYYSRYFTQIEYTICDLLCLGSWALQFKSQNLNKIFPGKILFKTFIIFFKNI